MSITYVWLLAGFLLAVAELHASGIGLFFIGLGAIAAGSSIYLGLVDAQDYMAQLLVCFATTGILAVLLWKPIQKFRRPAPGYHNIVGETAYVGSQGLTKKGGEVTWSGTIMKAQLVRDSAVEKLEAGAQVTIIEVTGATLTVKPKE